VEFIPVVIPLRKIISKDLSRIHPLRGLTFPFEKDKDYEGMGGRDFGRINS
jgi:hypothetical protein